MQFLVGAIALAALILAAVSFATSRTIPGLLENVGQQDASPMAAPGALEWVVLVTSAVLFVTAVIVLRRARTLASTVGSRDPSPPADVFATEPWVPLPESASPIPRSLVLRHLSDDERRVFLEIQSRRGSIYQNDLVALGIFSRAKVTRLLDKLEAKGIVVRERHGMTNRIRIVNEARR